MNLFTNKVQISLQISTFQLYDHKHDCFQNWNFILQSHEITLLTI